MPFVDYGEGATGDAYDATNSTLRIGHSFPGAKSQWGADFFAIPSPDFTPTIKVKYYVEDPKDDDPEQLITRGDPELLTAEIQFSSSFFEKHGQGDVTGKKNGINVFIKPAYLYVLSDYDQWIKHIVVQE